MFFQWNRDVSSGTRVDLEVQYDDDKWSHLGLTRSHCGLQRHLFVSGGWSPSRSPWSSPLRSPLLTGCSRLGVGSRNSWSLPHNIAVPSATGTMKSSHLCGVDTSSASIQQGWMSDSSKVSYSSVSATRTSPFQLLPLTRIRGIFQVKLSCQLGGTLTGLVHNLDNIQPLLRKESLGLQMVLGIASQTVVSPNRLPKGVFPILPGGLEHSADSSGTPWSRPTIFSSKPHRNSTAEVSSFYSAYRSSRNTIRLRSMRCRSSMIPW